ncbi:MAG: response regulator [Halanaerobiales bacterium]
MGEISVAIVDDHPFFRQGVCLYFENNKDIDIIYEFADGKEILQFLEEKHDKIDVIIMDLQMPEMDGGEATRIICKQWPEVKILVLTSYGSWDRVYSLLNSGAAGYLLKDANPDKLAAAIKAVYTGGTYFGNQVKKALLHNVKEKEDNNGEDFSDLIEPLTDREVVILKLIGQGLCNSKIADKLYISKNTVKTHISHIFQKLNVNSRTEAAFYAMQKGLIES